MGTSIRVELARRDREGHAAAGRDPHVAQPVSCSGTARDGAGIAIALVRSPEVTAAGTQLALISDVQGDVHALRDALVQIDQLGIDRIICCGELVDYGLFPEETLTLLRQRQIVCVRGNHDRWAARRSSAGSIGWDLKRQSMAFLGSLPVTLWLVVDGVRVAVHHARPKNDMAGIAHDAPERELVELAGSGRSRCPGCWPYSRAVCTLRSRWSPVCNPGALLSEPTPGTEVLAPGTFGILDARHREFTVRRAIDGEIMRHRSTR